MGARRSIAWMFVVLAACSAKKPAGGPQRDADQPPAVDGSEPVAAKEVTITIENRRASAIWVRSQTQCAQMPFAVTAPDGAPIQLDGQVLGCEAARSGMCPNFGGCQGAGAWRVEPGKTITASWSGLMMKTRTLSASEAKPGCPTTCADWVAAPAGTYVLTAAAYTACTGADCACPDGACQPSSLTGAPDLATDAPAVIHETGTPSGVLMVFQ